MTKKSEPTITTGNEDENLARVSFKPDLAKFKMSSLEDVVVALMEKCVIDLAGCFGETVKVELNGEQVPVKSYLDYVSFLRKLMIGGKSAHVFAKAFLNMKYVEERYNCQSGNN